MLSIASTNNTREKRKTITSLTFNDFIFIALEDEPITTHVEIESDGLIVPMSISMFAKKEGLSKRLCSSFYALINWLIWRYRIYHNMDLNKTETHAS